MGVVGCAGVSVVGRVQRSAAQRLAASGTAFPARTSCATPFLPAPPARPPAAAARPDLLPKAYLDSLSELQDRLPSFPSSIAFEVGAVDARTPLCALPPPWAANGC